MLSKRLPFAVVAFMLVAPAVATACPFCAAPSLTQAEQVSQSDAVILVKWVSAKKTDGLVPGTTEYEIKKIHKGSKASLGVGKTLTLSPYRAGKPNQLFLLMGRKTVNVEWGTPLEVSEASYQYIAKSPHPKKKTLDRLKYYLQYLEFPDELVSNDAYAEFANAPYKDIAKLAKSLPRERIRKWVSASDTPPTRLGLYGLLLGLCGKKADAKLMEKKILAESKEYRLGIEGVMSGYLLLTGEDGLETLEDAKLRDKKVAFSETYAAMQAVGFMWEYAPGRISKQRLRNSMRLLLDRPTTADLVIANLARWKDWAVQDRLMKLYDKKDYNIPAVKRAIVRYLLVCSKDVDEKNPKAKIPQHVTKAKANLKVLRKKDPKTVADAERFFY